MQIEALVAKSAVEALGEAVLDRLARPNEAQLDAVQVGPLIECLARALGAIVEDQAVRVSTALLSHSVEHSRRTLARQRSVELDRRAFPSGIIDHVQHARDAARGQGVAHEIHRPVESCHAS